MSDDYFFEDYVNSLEGLIDIKPDRDLCEGFIEAIAMVMAYLENVDPENIVDDEYQYDAWEGFDNEIKSEYLDRAKEIVDNGLIADTYSIEVHDWDDEDWGPSDGEDGLPFPEYWYTGEKEEALESLGYVPIFGEDRCTKTDDTKYIKLDDFKEYVHPLYPECLDKDREYGERLIDNYIDNLCELRDKERDEVSDEKDNNVDVLETDDKNDDIDDYDDDRIE